MTQADGACLSQAQQAVSKQRYNYDRYLYIDIDAYRMHAWHMELRKDVNK